MFPSRPGIAGRDGAGAGSSATSPASPGAAAGAADWPTYHGTMSRAGVSTTMPAASGTPKRIQSLKLDGEVYASPIVVRGLTIVATEQDTVYAFDQSYRQVWKRSLGSPSPAEERQCGDINPLGITGTPVYDATTNHVFVVAEHGGSVRHELYALDAASGRVAWSTSVDLPGVSARDMQQRGALAIADNRVWVSYGAQAGDCGNYKGRVVGVPLGGGNDVIFYSPPTKRGGGIWNPNGPTVNAAGHLLVVSANGAAFPGDAYDHTNSVLELDANAKVVDSFAPSDWAANNQGDVGLGSQGVALIGTKWAVLGGKSGPVYVLRQGDLGGIGGQVGVQDICKSFGGAAVDGNVVYLPCTDGVPRGPGRQRREAARAVAHVRLDHRVAGYRWRAHLGPRHDGRRAARARSVHRHEPRPGRRRCRQPVRYTRALRRGRDHADSRWHRRRAHLITPSRPCGTGTVGGMLLRARGRDQRPGA